MDQISALSKEYLVVPFTSNVDSETIGSAEMAFTVGPRTPPTTWHAATITSEGVQLLIGPGEVPLTPGDWAVWVRIVDAPEVPVEVAGMISIF